MNPAAGRRERHDLEAACLHALRALPADEVPDLEAHLAWCAGCRTELEALRAVVDAFAAWPTDVLRPSASLRERLAERLAMDTGTPAPAPPAPAPPPAAPDAEWTEVGAGISCKLLATETATNRVTMLVRLAPGTDYPPHRHADTEELYMLDGELIVDGEKFYPGDYRRGGAGTIDRRVWSETGCTCVLITSFRDVIL